MDTGDIQQHLVAIVSRDTLSLDKMEGLQLKQLFGEEIKRVKSYKNEDICMIASLELS